MTSYSPKVVLGEGAQDPVAGRDQEGLDGRACPDLVETEQEPTQKQQHQESEVQSAWDPCFLGGRSIGVIYMGETPRAPP